MGKIMKNGENYSGWGSPSGGGSTVSVTQIQSTGTKIATITVDNVDTDLYAPNSGGGTTVVANPSGAATETLSKLQVGNDIYSIPSGGGGSSTVITNKSNFNDIYSALTGGQFINKLSAIFANATYYIRNIPAVKVSDMTTTTLSITAGAGIIYFDASEFKDITQSGSDYEIVGTGVIRIVVPNNGGEYDFNGIIYMSGLSGNGFTYKLGRGILSFYKSNERQLYFTTGNADGSGINTSTSQVREVYAEMI